VRQSYTSTVAQHAHPGSVIILFAPYTRWHVFVAVAGHEYGCPVLCQPQLLHSELPLGDVATEKAAALAVR